MDSSRQVLVHAGRVLVDEKTMEEYNVRENDIFVVMQKREGRQQTSDKPATGDTSAVGSSSSSLPRDAPTTSPCDLASPESVPLATVDVPQNSTKAPSVEDGAIKDQSATVSAPTAYEAAASAFAGGDSLAAAIEQIRAMGFPPDRIEAAMTASFHNPDRAVEYLMNGFNEPAVPAADTQPGLSAGQANTNVPIITENRPSGGNLAPLRNHPLFEQMRRAIQAEPHLLPQLLHSIGEQNPRLAELIVHNQEEFLQMISETPNTSNSPQRTPPEAGDGSHPVQLQLTQAEMDAVSRIQALGFPFEAAVQAYFACDKNEEYAANFLFDNIDDILDSAEADSTS